MLFFNRNCKDTLFGGRALAVGHQQLDISSWTVAVGIWLLAIGFELNLNG